MDGAWCLFLLPVHFLLVNSQFDCIPGLNITEVTPSMQLPSEGVRLFLEEADQPIPSYLMLRYDQITTDIPLWCQTDDNTPSHNGQWNQPPGAIPPGYTKIQSNLSDQQQVYQAVTCVGEVALLRHSDNITDHEGILQCTILDKSNMQHSLYVGVYSGEFYDNYTGPLLSPMEYVLVSARDANIPAFELSFTSSNGPPTNVTCALDGADLSSSSYNISRVVTNPQSNGGTTTVTISMMTNQGGEYSCTVIVIGQVQAQLRPLGSNTTRLNITTAETPLIIVAARIAPSIIVVNRSDVEEYNWFEVFYRANGIQQSLTINSQVVTTVQLHSLLESEAYEIFVVGFGINKIPVRSNTVQVLEAASIVILKNGSDQQLSQNFVLECVVTVGYDLNGDFDIRWINPNNETVSFERFGSMSAGLNASSSLDFELLSPSNDGVFTCEANISDFLLVTSFEVSSQPIMFILERENSNSGIIAGDNSSITCSAVLPESLSLPVSFLWVKENITVTENQTVLFDNPMQNTSTIEFRPVRTSSGGVYECVLRVNETMNIVLGQINFTVSIPTLQVTIISTSPIVETSQLTLCCSVSLDTSIVDSPVLIEYQWVGPNGVVVNTTDITVSVGLFSTAIVFRAVQLNDSGDYLCNVTVLPMNNNVQSTGNTASALINVIAKLVCDPDNTTTEQFGSYDWPETAVGDTVQLPCVFRSGYNASRTCTQGGSWVAVNVTNCRIISPASVNFTVYLRFTSMLDRILLGRSIPGALQTIENVVLEMVNITAIKCSNVLSIGEGNDRVECTVNGSTDSQNQLRNASLNQIFVVLQSNNFSIGGAEVFSEIGFCNENNMTTQTSGVFHWNETEVNSTATSGCFYGPTDEIATRQCVSRLTWAPPSFDQCRTVVSQRFNDIQQVNVSTENVVQLVRNLSNLTAAAQLHVPDQNSDNAVVVAMVLTEAANVVQNASLNEVEEVTKNAVDILDNIEEWPMDRINEQSNTIVEAFENIVDTLIGHNNFTNTTIVTEDIVLTAETIKRDQFVGQTLTVEMNGTVALLVNVTDTDNIVNINELTPNLDSVLSIPKAVLSRIPNKEDVRIAFAVYDSTTLFPVRITSQNFSADETVVGSQIVSGIVSGINRKPINPPVTFSLRLINYVLLPGEYATSRRCVFWDFNAANGQGDWSTEGCIMTQYNQATDVVVCECDHLTNFACLVDISIRVNSNATGLPHEYVLALEIVTYVGVFFSLAGLTLLILTHLILKNIRQKDVTKFHVQLALSMILMLIAFVAGIDRTENRAGCITVGVLLHYLILVTWMWMAAEAVLLFQKLVLVFKKTTTLYIVIVSIVCWACPLLPVVISVSINPDNYIHNMQPDVNRGFCFISDLGVFLGAFLGPIFLVIIFNIVVFICSTFIVIKHKIEQEKAKTVADKQSNQKRPMSGSKACKLLLSLTGIMFLLGLSWVVLLFTVVGIEHSIEAAFAIQLLFVFFNSFQGFFLFIFIVVLNQDSRKQWAALLCPCMKKKGGSTTSRYRRYISSNGLTKNTSSVGENTLERKDYEKELTTTSSEAVSTDVIVTSSTDVDNDETMMFGREPKNMRKLRRSTFRRTHHVETVEIDFFDENY